VIRNILTLSGLIAIALVSVWVFLMGWLMVAVFVWLLA
jgi:hypothetical protein